MEIAEQAIAGAGWLRRARSCFFVCVAAFVTFMLLGNLLITAAWVWAPDTGATGPRELAGIGNFAVVDDHLWRGAAPSDEGYRQLAARGVTTIVDLRAEEGIDIPEHLQDRYGMKVVRLPMRDGQAPSPRQVDQFLKSVAGSPGRVFVHCGAGVGRTGTMAAAYLVETGQASPFEALRRNLEIGPPSLEQIAFVAGLTPDDAGRPNPVLTFASRVLDGPRRLWVNFTH